MDKITEYYYNGEYGTRLPVLEMGIHERMPPGVIRHGGRGAPYLGMFFHDEAEIYSENGSGTAARGSFILWDREARHIYGNPGQAWDHSWIFLESAPMHEPFSLNRLHCCGGEEVFLHYLRLMARELRRPKPEAWLLDHLVAMLLGELGRLTAAGTPVPDGLEQAVRFMEKHLEEALTLDAVAAVAGWSPSRFLALFRRFYGVPPMRYLNSLRLRRARRLLEYPGMTVKEAAIRSGFADPLYFSRCYRREYGESPAMRKRQNFAEEPATFRPNR